MVSSPLVGMVIFNFEHAYRSNQILYRDDKKKGPERGLFLTHQYYYGISVTSPEITNTFRYRINEHWLPYFELRWLDRNVGPYHREQNQIRIGAKYFF
ncbi:oligogalacturonate-specific porin protein [Salmonella phage JD01]|uniref:Oligogalacturonate-specific porin protein n=1 Tax=Salmonella phage JD01 TaxID=2831178 RepID=A0A8E6L6Q3_9CAUD|nr:oligogalacturonate-specific porin protein [Salmonella phage JD01]QVQ56281.1 oligogalacturonate-specific porin protein [Salmonella phage JD01]